MNKLALVAVAALTAATFGTAAIAQDAPAVDLAVDITAVDTNIDGFVDLAEAQVLFPALTQEQFTTADVNADGRLDATEYGALSASLGISRLKLYFGNAKTVWGQLSDDDYICDTRYRRRARRVVHAKQRGQRRRRSSYRSYGCRLLHVAIADPGIRIDSWLLAIQPD